MTLQANRCTLQPCHYHPPFMSSSQRHDAFVMEMLNGQRRLEDYIFTLVFDRDRASDILQQTNMAILKNEAKFEPGTNFGAWACKIAYFEVLADRRRRHRDRHMFDDDLLHLIAESAAGQADSSDLRSEALAECLRRLSDEQRELISARYAEGGSVTAIARAGRTTPAAVSSLLYRIRSLLIDCIDQKIAKA